MKSRSTKSVAKRRLASFGQTLPSLAVCGGAKVRRRMLKWGQALIKERNYPRHTIVKELARLFASKFISERN